MNQAVCMHILSHTWCFDFSRQLFRPDALHPRSHITCCSVWLRPKFLANKLLRTLKRLKWFSERKLIHEIDTKKFSHLNRHRDKPVFNDFVFVFEPWVQHVDISARLQSMCRCVVFCAVCRLASHAGRALAAVRCSCMV